LTSDECTQILVEREEKKKKELEEKAQRKAERERKKLEKEAAAREKAEKHKEVNRQRAEKKANKVAEQLASNAKPKRTRRFSDEEVEQQSEPLLSENPEATVKTVEAPPEQFPEDMNQCCMCFEMYEPDTEWVQCVCKRWLHEECYTEVVVDKYGRELLCPSCVR